MLAGLATIFVLGKRSAVPESVPELTLKNPAKLSIALGFAGGLLGLMDLARDSGQVLHMVADLVRDHIGLSELAGRGKAPGELFIEAQVDIDLAIARTVERSHRRISGATGR